MDRQLCMHLLLEELEYLSNTASILSYELMFSLGCIFEGAGEAEGYHLHGGSCWVSDS